MKVVITRRFRDADTGQIMYVGHVAEYSAERAMRLERSGYVKLMEKAEQDSESEKGEGDLFTPKNEQPPHRRRGRKPRK